MMRSTLVLAAFSMLPIVASTSFAQGDGDNGPADRCESTDCFNQRQIRDVDVVSPHTMIVYVGAQKCPFLVDLIGTFCDLTYFGSYNVIFRTGREARERLQSGANSSRVPLSEGRQISSESVLDVFGSREGVFAQNRVCANDINMGIESSAFTSSLGGDDGDPDGLSCRIRDVRSITDDELIEIMVDNELTAPPPPFGTGRVEAPENPVEPTAQPADEPADESARDRRRRLRRERDAASDADGN